MLLPEGKRNSFTQYLYLRVVAANVSIYMTQITLTDIMQADGATFSEIMLTVLF